jgi:hypothetical protein
MEPSSSFAFTRDGQLWSVLVPSDILDSERSLYALNFVNTNSHISAKQAVFDKRYPGIGWAYNPTTFPATSFTAAGSFVVSASSIYMSSPSEKKNNYSPHASSENATPAKKNAPSHISTKNIRPLLFSTSTTSSHLSPSTTAAYQHSSSKKPMIVSTKNTGGWMGSTSTR